MKRNLSTRRRHRQYTMRPTKLNVRRLAFLVVTVLTVVRIGCWFFSRGDGLQLIERLDEDYNTKSFQEDMQSSSIGGNFLERKSEKEVDYEFDERNSELGDMKIALNTNSSEEYYYDESEDKIDEGDRGEWSVDSREEVRSSLNNNTPPVDVAASVTKNIVTNKTNDIHNYRTLNESDLKTDGHGADVSLDDADVTYEDGKINQDTLEQELADVGGGGDQFSMATAEHDDAEQLQHHQVTAPRGDVAQENNDDYENVDYENDDDYEDSVDHENNVDHDIVDHEKDREANSGGMATERMGEIDQNGVELSKNGSIDLHPLDDNSKHVAEKRNDDYSVSRQPFLQQRGSGEEDNKTTEEKKEEDEEEEKKEEKDDEKEEKEEGRLMTASKIKI